ncbi:MAG TPA: efflux RND transporter periplasmic adaptor subunit [Terriglobales bacterium]|nr:efflux RND transporter periplasmic adaptor subunit [Terriglobales bacterium]
MMRTSKSFPFFAFLAVFAIAGCSEKKPEQTVAAETVRGVHVVTVSAEPAPDLAEVTGTVRAAQTAIVSSETMGVLRQVDVREGDRVRRGQALAVIDDAAPHAAVNRAQAGLRSAEQQVAAAEADYNLASATLGRYQDLRDKKSVSPQEFDEVKARHDAAAAQRERAQAGRNQAQAELAQAQTVFGYTRVRAPFDGVVAEKRVDPGTLAAPGMPLFVVEDTSSFRAEAPVDEQDLRYLEIGKPVPVLVEALGAELAGKVAQILPAADPASRSFLVKVQLPKDDRLRSGLFARVRYARAERPMLLLPRAAVIERGQVRGVFVLDADGVARLQFVTLGREQGERIEALSGVKAGDRIVADPSGRDLAGKRIEVSP